jgi:hypothetical protein
VLVSVVDVLSLNIRETATSSIVEKARHHLQYLLF